MTKAETLLRWTDHEWTLVSGAAAPLVHQGLSDLEALMKAQRTVLPKPRQREKVQMKSMLQRSKNRNGPAQRYIDEAVKAYRKVSAPLPAPMPAPVLTAAVQGVNPKVHAASRDAMAMQKQQIRWLPIEWAAVAVECKRLQDSGDERALSSLILSAQEAVLIPSRWRGRNSIYTGETGGNNARFLAQGWKDQWMLKPDEVPAAPPEAVIEMVTHTPAPEAPPKPVEAPSVAPELPRATTLPVQSPRGAFGFAMQAFASQIEAALDTLLTAHAAHIYTTLDERMERAAENIGLLVAKQITDGLRSTVVGIMSEELGGPVTPPSAPGAPPVPSAPPAASPSVPPLPVASMSAPYEAQGLGYFEAERVASVPVSYKGQPRREPQAEEYPPDDPADEGKVKVDVVGLTGNSLAEVRNAFNGHTSLRFIDPEHVGSWVPRRDCRVVLATRFIPHTANLKCVRYHVKPILAKGAGASVIAAIAGIHREEGVPV